MVLQEKRLKLTIALLITKLQIRLENAEIRAPVKPVSEVCSCPAGYTGVQCSSCAWSHARILHAAGAVPPFECVPCACNEHASCDTGQSINHLIIINNLLTVYFFLSDFHSKY